MLVEVRMKVQILLVPVILIALIGCSYQVPLQHKVALKTAPNVKNENVLIMMSKEQAEKVISFSPQYGDTYVFNSGPALKDMVLNILGQMYSHVFYAESLEGTVEKYDRAIGVKLVSHDIVMNIYTGNEVTLEVEYSIYDSTGKLIETFPTLNSSKERYSGGDLAEVFILGAGSNISKMKKQIGAAWDKSTIISVGKLMNHLNEE
jgi:hypothetical protein